MADSKLDRGISSKYLVSIQRCYTNIKLRERLVDVHRYACNTTLREEETSEE